MNTKRISLLAKLNYSETLINTVAGAGFALIVISIVPNIEIASVKLGGNFENSWILSLLGIVLSLLAFPFFKEKTEETLIQVFSESRLIQQEFKNIYSSIDREAIFWAGNFYISVKEHKNILLDKLRNGANIKYLIFNPDSFRRDIVLEDFNDTTREFLIDCETTIKALKELKEEWNMIKSSKNAITSGSLEIRLYNYIPRVRAYIIDPNDVKKYSYFVHFLYKHNSSDLPAFKIKNSNSEVIKKYMHSFSSIWECNTTVPIDSYTLKLIR
ncbi:hypothetical protein [Spirosoma fluviale]|uniref:Uncharacterized protein n=1 Tax=Spirosoma fluviale TaxID=1597977 RepID=A0A286FDS5_9BACT|nr:hypothetical protein [Spirosoma fluviale]SOD80974.1 hypothetical protein SAMN06269250_1630 [Spirosoma fluviale]